MYLHNTRRTENETGSEGHSLVGGTFSLRNFIATKFVRMCINAAKVRRYISTDAYGVNNNYRRLRGNRRRLT